MKISLSWLRQLVVLPAGIGWQEIARRLTMAGLEVEGAAQVGAGLSGAVVAEIRGRRPHPRADKLTLVNVFDGQATTQVVCGAPNVPPPGDPGRPSTSRRVVWARPGATLPSGLVLGEKEVRGVRSPGMLCAEDELGLSEDHGGILLLSPEDGVAIGADFAGAAGLPDVVLELNVTPNRPDCLGHVGVAREVAALFSAEGARLTLPALDLGASEAGAPATESVAVEVREAEGCPRYTARVIRGVTVGRSPLHIRLRLQRLGVRALSNVVDATNLALLLWGQPLHAFDLDRLRGRRVIVRRAAAGEAMTTLDGARRTLSPDDLLIADAEQGVAVAGVMGGQESEVTDATRDILLEGAYFSPAWVRRTARGLKLHTEASHRFERGVDPNQGLVAASADCARLLAELCGGRVAPGLIDVYPRPIEARTIPLRPARTALVVGTEVPAEEQARLLSSLGLGVGVGPGGALAVTVPTSRPDLTREADLIEEVARLHGYDRIPERLPPLRLGQAGQGREQGLPSALADRARDLCCALSLDEIHTFSFVAPERLRQLGFGAEDRRAAPLILHNPMREEISAMRTQLIVGLLEALRHNLSHGEGDVRLFEVNEVFLPGGAGTGGAPEERTRVAGVMCGHRDHWLKAGAADELDFFDLRGVVDELLRGLGVAAPVRAARPGEVPWLHPGVAAVLTGPDGATVGELGEVHPDLRARLGLDPGVRAFAFELDLPLTAPPLPIFVPLLRFPAVSRDLSFFVDAAIPAGQILATLRGAGEALLAGVEVLEDYREAGRVPAGRKGLLLALTYRSPERTLTDDEARAAHERVVGHLRGQISIDLR